MRRWSTLVALVFAVACSGSGEAPSDDDSDVAGDDDHGECSRDLDCPIGVICLQPDGMAECDGTDNCVCVSTGACAVDTDCPGPSTCHVRTRVCARPQCRADDDCSASLVCLAGDCSVRPDVSSVHDCVLSAPRRVLAAGASVALTATAFAGALDTEAAFGPPLIPALTAQWIVVNGDFTIDAGGVVTAGPDAGTGVVSATFGPSSCSLTLWNLGAAASGDLRVVVSDAATGAPIEDALVTVTLPSGDSSGPTGADGVRTIAGAGTTALLVTAFASGHDIVSYVEPGARELTLALPVAGAAAAYGFQGELDLSGVSPRGDFVLGFTGAAASPGALAERGPAAVFGPPTDVVLLDLEIAGVEPLKDVQLPSSVVFDSREDDIKPGYTTRAAPGRHAVWAIAGYLPAPAFGELLFAGGAPSAAAGNASTPGSFSHGFVPAVRMSGGAPVEGSAPPYEPLDVQVTERLALYTELAVPELPDDPQGSGWFAGALVVVGRSSPYFGFVPMGFARGFDVRDGDEVADGVVNGTGLDPYGNPLPYGHIGVDYAPAHHGLEDGRVVVVALALPDNPSPVRFAGVARSFERLDETAELEASGLGFTTGALAGRTLTLECGTGAGAHRVTLRAPTSWHVWSGPCANARTSELPAVPDGFADPVVAPERIVVAALRASFADTVRDGSAGVDAWAVQELP